MNIPFVPNREEYLAMILQETRVSPSSEMVPLRRAVNRVTASEIRCTRMIPDVPLSAMDGIAIHFDRLVSDPARMENWVSGVDYVFSNTGNAVDEQFDTVVLIEQVTVLDGGGVRLAQFPSFAGENINPPGSMLWEGEVLLAKGYRITPSQLGLLAAGGIRKVNVVRKPRIVIIPTGDELVPVDLPLPQGKNVETNGLVLEAFIQQWGGEPILYPIVPDDQERLTQTLRQAASEGDIVILNAGSSKGSRDYARNVLGKLGKVYCYEVAHGPAKCTSFTMIEETPVLGIVGPAVPAEMTMAWYIRPLIEHILGCPITTSRYISAVLTREARSHVPFDFYMQAMVQKTAEGAYRATPLITFRPNGVEMSTCAMGLSVQPGTSHSNRVEMSARANGILKIPGGRVFQEGEEVEIELKVP
ncbi:MAG: molybdopterin molybdotransferase MoeA [Syntrophomonas sp.]